MLEDYEVIVGETPGRRDVMEESSAGMVCGYPVSIGLGDLVVDPGEWTLVRPRHQGPGLPAELEPLVLAFVLVDSDGWVKDELFAATRADPRIEEAHSVAGNSNFLLKVRVADPDELEDVLHDLYRVEGLVRSRTIMVLRRGFERGVGLPPER